MIRRLSQRSRRPAFPGLLLLLACQSYNREQRDLARQAHEAFDQGDFEKASKLAESALDLTAGQREKVSDPHGEALYVIGALTARKGDTLRAAQQLDEAVRYSPKLEPAWVLLAQLQRQLKLDDDAVRSYEQTVWLDQDNPEYRARLCWAHLDLKHQEAAIATCAMAVEKGPNNPDALGGYAVALTRAGKEAEAAAQLAPLHGMLAAVRDPVLEDVERAMQGVRTGR